MGCLRVMASGLIGFWLLLVVVEFVEDRFQHKQRIHYLTCNKQFSHTTNNQKCFDKAIAEKNAHFDVSVDTLDLRIDYANQTVVEKGDSFMNGTFTHHCNVFDDENWLCPLHADANKPYPQSRSWNISRMEMKDGVFRMWLNNAPVPEERDIVLHSKSVTFWGNSLLYRVSRLLGTPPQYSLEIERTYFN